MKRHWIEYSDKWLTGPMSFWVHVETDGRAWYHATSFSPPSPRPVPGRGYATFYVDVSGFTFRFASLEELRVCIATLSRRVLPTTIAESARRGTPHGPNGHWLSTLPARLLPWRRRQRIVKYLSETLDAFECTLGVPSDAAHSR